MKKIMLFLSIAIAAVSCNPKSETAANTETAASTAVPLSMQPTYSSSFEMGNPSYAAMIVQGSWKDWQDNKLDNMRNWVADTIVAFQSNNIMIRGADSLMANWKRSRAGYSSAIDSINAVMPVYSTDKKQNWVLVWATEYDTKLDGTKDTSATMETWRINKDGKADLLLQFDRHTRKQ
jgi:hypothetical protein